MGLGLGRVRLPYWIVRSPGTRLEAVAAIKHQQQHVLLGYGKILQHGDVAKCSPPADVIQVEVLDILARAEQRSVCLPGTSRCPLIQAWLHAVGS